MNIQEGKKFSGQKQTTSLTGDNNRVNPRYNSGNILNNNGGGYNSKN